MSLSEIRRRALEKRRGDLIAEYQATHGQLEAALSSAEQIRLKRQIIQLEEEIEQIESQLELRCTSCGAANREIAKFCAKCGRPIGKEESVQSSRADSSARLDLSDPTEPNSGNNTVTQGGVFIGGDVNNTGGTIVGGNYNTPHRSHSR